MDRELAEARQEIDALDRAILGLLARRMEAVEALFERKRAQALPLHDPGREAQLLTQRRELAVELGLSVALSDAVFTAILEESHRRSVGDGTS